MKADPKQHISVDNLLESLRDLSKNLTLLSGIYLEKPETTNEKMLSLMEQIKENLHLASRGNQSAARRARVGSIKLAKVSKVFRKESIREGKELKCRRKNVFSNFIKYSEGSR